MDRRSLGCSGCWRKHGVGDVDLDGPVARLGFIHESRITRLKHQEAMCHASRKRGSAGFASGSLS